MQESLQNLTALIVAQCSEVGSDFDEPVKQWKESIEHQITPLSQVIIMFHVLLCQCISRD